MADMLEARVAGLESDLGDVKVKSADIKEDLRDAGAVGRRFKALDASFARLLIWLISIVFGFSAVILGGIGKGFHWL